MCVRRHFREIYSAYVFVTRCVHSGKFARDLSAAVRRPSEGWMPVCTENLSELMT
jgi:hypothetical protein